MVKVKEDSAMAEAPKPATTTQTSINNPTNNNNSLHNNIRKPRNNGHNHTHHLHQTFHHYTYVHHHCTFSPDNPGDGPNNGSTSPAKFYFGPGFEPQAQIPGGSFGPGPSQVQNNSEYVVLLHVNPGVTINFQIGDNLEILRERKFLVW